jgi:DNA-binding NarL/FixJ family response regulator
MAGFFLSVHGGQMIRVMIAEPYKITRECLRSFLEREQDIEVLAAADRLDQAVSLSLQSQPDVVLLDIDLQDSRGLETLRGIMLQPSPPAVVVLALAEDLAMKEEFLQAGAKAYYCWRDPLTEMLEAIRSVHAGQIYLSHPASSGLPTQAAPVGCP